MPNSDVLVRSQGSATTYDAGASELPLDLEGAAVQTQLWVVQRAIEENYGNITKAARLLGTSRNKIYRALGQEDQI